MTHFVVCSGAYSGVGHRFRSTTWVTAETEEEALEKAQVRLLPSDSKEWAHIVRGDHLLRQCELVEHKFAWFLQEEES